MDMNEKRELIKGFLPDIEWYSAGKLVYIDTDKGRKKHHAIPHKDGQPINKDTNVLKGKLDDKYLVIDSDGADLTELANLFPSILKTFATRTTAINKRHFYFKPIKGIHGVRKTGLEANGEYDIFTTGVMFEGHTIPQQDEEWVIMNDSEVATLTEGEVDLITHLCRNSIATGNTSQGNRYFKNASIASIVMQVIEDGHLPKDNKTFKQLMIGITTKDYRDAYAKSRKRVPLPDFNHNTFNTMAFKLSYNTMISHISRDKFLNILLHEGYEVDINSSQTHTHLHKSIYATLPRHEGLDAVAQADSFKESLLFTLTNGKYVVRFVTERGILNYMFLDEHSLKPLPFGKHGGVTVDSTSATLMTGFDKETFLSIPQVIVVSNPFIEYLTFDGALNMTVLNLSQQSEYYNSATPIPMKPNNVLTRLIYSYCGDKYEEFYYHWLAHLMYHTRTPQTMPMFVSSPQDKAGTGKSTLAQAIPARLVRATATADVGTTDNAWGDLTFGRKLIAFNDIKSMSKAKWEPIYAFCKDNTTAGTFRIHNMKHAGIVIDDSVTAFSFSANWIPPLDEHDRRLWIVMPQMLYGNTNWLSDEDSLALNHMIESSSITEHHDDFQELANYLLYLYKNYRDKYNIELYKNAPMTEYRGLAVKQQRNFSESLVSSLRNSPQELENLVGSEEMLFISKFILVQYYTDTNKLYLPTTFMSKLLNLTKKDSITIKYTNKRLESALGMNDDSFKNRGLTRVAYKEEDNLGAFDESEKFEIMSYVHTQCVIDITEEVIEKYKSYIIENNV